MLPNTEGVEMAKAKKGAAVRDYDPEEMRRRAFAAWFRTGGTDQPDGHSGCVERDGKHYVVLFNVNGILAVYRIRNDGNLKRLRRWPSGIDESL